MSSQIYHAIARRKLNTLQSLIPKNWLLDPLPEPLPLDVRPLVPKSTVLTPDELSITSSHDVTSLSQLIHSRALTSEAITTAFCKRAAIAQQLTNCLSEILFLPAIERAQALDAEYKRTGKTRGPLHGIPISLKDTYNIKGYDSSIGMASLAENPAKENAALVDILLEQGAVLYCKTNVSQTLMALDSHNHLFGRVMNPRNRRVTAGGSSGGEGALVAMRGSVLGIGTDIGGSVRIPAMCNGLYSIKPSSQRLPFMGQEIGQLPGIDKLGLQASAGLMTTSVRDCELFLKAIADANPWEKDPNVAFGSWEGQGEIRRKPLFGVLRADGITTPLPPVAKVLYETVEALRTAGFEVVEINAPGFKKYHSLANSFFGMGGFNHTFDLLERTGEPLIPWLDTRLRRKSPADLMQLSELHVRKSTLEKEMLGIWRDEKGRMIDALICPVAPHPVPEIDRWNGVGYTSAFVVLDYPAGTLPVRDVSNDDLMDELPESDVLGGWDSRNRDLCKLSSFVSPIILSCTPLLHVLNTWFPLPSGVEAVVNPVLQDYTDPSKTGHPNTNDRSVYLNTKLSVQVVAPRLQERRLYQAMALIDEVLHGASSESP
ncbi:Amidase [Penicillium bovifimosum]|uniref:amidase n=1 Tax=Penicillium bovifimosum TaxID=126998 RepID=A0A9W9GMR2_9EURO|nr:Amidase [Penicillium bovifimosum]KAJ5124456.1 Amidase [Penicillium bovifimosum]